MRWYLRAMVTGILVGLGSASGFAQSLQESLEDLLVGERWQYNDWEAAQAAAAASGKPILALFR